MFKSEKAIFLKIFLILISIGLFPLESKAYWSFELFGGAALNLPTPLNIHQDGEEDIDVNANYRGEPFNSEDASPYYDVRVGWWEKGRAWEIELLHHKLILNNRPQEVQKFEVSNGFNLLTLNRAWTHRGFIYRLGGGLVITYPYSTIRGREHATDGGIFNSGYYISGPTLQASAGKRFFILEHLFFALEAKLTTSYARVPIQDGKADVTNVAFHGQFGIGMIF